MPTVVELKEELLSKGLTMREINKLKLKSKLIQKLEELNLEKENSKANRILTRRSSTQNTVTARLIGMEKERPSSDQFFAAKQKKRLSIQNTRSSASSRSSTSSSRSSTGSSINQQLHQITKDYSEIVGKVEKLQFALEMKEEEIAKMNRYISRMKKEHSNEIQQHLEQNKNLRKQIQQLQKNQNLNGDEGENNEIELLRKELADAQRIAEEERRVCAEMCEAVDRQQALLSQQASAQSEQEARLAVDKREMSTLLAEMERQLSAAEQRHTHDNDARVAQLERELAEVKAAHQMDKLFEEELAKHNQQLEKELAEVKQQQQLQQQQLKEAKQSKFTTPEQTQPQTPMVPKSAVQQVLDWVAPETPFNAHRSVVSRVNETPQHSMSTARVLSSTSPVVATSSASTPQALSPSLSDTTSSSPNTSDQMTIDELTTDAPSSRPVVEAAARKTRPTDMRQSVLFGVFQSARGSSESARRLVLSPKASSPITSQSQYINPTPPSSSNIVKPLLRSKSKRKSIGSMKSLAQSVGPQKNAQSALQQMQQLEMLASFHKSRTGKK